MRFHDEKFDGIVLKIPQWFIGLNNLDEPIKQLEKALQTCTLSMHHPDHTSNLYELHSYKHKKEKLEREAARVKEIQMNRDERIRRLVSNEEYELEWVGRKSHFDLSDSGFTFRNSTFGHDEVFTNQLHIKSSFRHWFSRSVTSKDDFLEVAKKNSNVRLMQDLLDTDSDWIDLYGHTLFYSRQGWDQLGIGYKRLNVKAGMRMVNGSLRYTLCPLVRFKDGTLGFDQESLPGFTVQGLKLVKE